MEVDTSDNFCTNMVAKIKRMNYNVMRAWLGARPTWAVQTAWDNTIVSCLHSKSNQLLGLELIFMHYLNGVPKQKCTR